MAKQSLIPSHTIFPTLLSATAFFMTASEFAIGIGFRYCRTVRLAWTLNCCLTADSDATTVFSSSPRSPLRSDGAELTTVPVTPVAAAASVTVVVPRLRSPSALRFSRSSFSCCASCCIVSSTSSKASLRPVQEIKSAGDFLFLSPFLSATLYLSPKTRPSIASDSVILDSLLVNLLIVIRKFWHVKRVHLKSSETSRVCLTDHVGASMRRITRHAEGFQVAVKVRSTVSVLPSLM